MADVFSKAKRSAVMSRIRGAGNKDTELRLIGLMREAGITGWRRGAKMRARVAAQGEVAGRKGSRRNMVRRRHQRLRRGEQTVEEAAASYGMKAASTTVKTNTMTIRPDFVFPKQKLAVFVDGCFFHGCSQHVTWPKQNAEFWRTKIEGNMARDRLQNRLLREKGWRVLRIWEHALTLRNSARTVARLRRAIET